MGSAAELVWPKIAPVEDRNIPDVLKSLLRWVPWKAGPIKLNGKFDKYPFDPVTGEAIDPLNPDNWMNFEDALKAAKRRRSAGVGIVLSDECPISSDGGVYYVTAIDLDNCADHMIEHRALWDELGQPYVEVSPSGRGLRMVGLSRVAVKGGNAGQGRELYCSGRFVTMTGLEGRGQICDITEGAERLDKLWFGDRATQKVQNPSQVVKPTLVETKENVAVVLSMLDAVSSDTTYEIWRDIIWSVASIGWVCAGQIAHQWSAKSAHRYDAAVVDGLLQDFDPSRGITIGTLAHHARKNGWSGTLPSVQTGEPRQPSDPPQLPLLMTAEQLRQIPATPYAVRGILPARGVAAIFGEPGSGKSFLALDLAHAIAAGIPYWFGFPVNAAPVVYVALEGQGGIGKRLTALEKHSAQACVDNLRFCIQGIQLLTGDGIDELAAEIVRTVGMGAVVFIDTLNQASPGAEENSSQDMGKIIASAKRLASMVEGIVVLVHHAGKTRERGLRGHSSLLAAMDAVIEVVNDGGARSWRVTKAKDDSSDVFRDFDLTPYEVGQDIYGPITSCAVQQAAHVRAQKRREPTGKNQKAALLELRRVMTASDQVLDYTSVLTQVAAVLDDGKGRERDRAKESVEALIRDGHLVRTDGGLTLA